MFGKKNPPKKINSKYNIQKKKKEEKKQTFAWFTIWNKGITSFVTLTIITANIIYAFLCTSAIVYLALILVYKKQINSADSVPAATRKQGWSKPTFKGVIIHPVRKLV